MPNPINIQVVDLTDVLALYDKVQIWRSATSTGTFTEITDVNTRVSLNSQDDLYVYTDDTGSSTDFYKSRFYNSTTQVVSEFSSVLDAAGQPIAQLLENMEVTVTISGDISDMSGNKLGTDQVISFFTTFNPFYTNIRRVRLEIGSYLSSISDSTIAIAILESSLLSNSLNWSQATTTTWLSQVRKEWTTCKTIDILIQNVINSGGLKSKKLDNFMVTYDSTHGVSIQDKIAQCLARWESQLVSGGRAIQSPSMVIKGQCDPDAPNVGRMWESSKPGLNREPGANYRYRPPGKRRFTKGWF